MQNGGPIEASESHAETGLAALLSPALDAAFDLPAWTGTGPAATHMPFVAWLTAGLAPATVLGAPTSPPALQAAIEASVTSAHLPCRLLDPAQAQAHAGTDAIDLLHTDAAHLEEMLARNGAALSPRAVLLVWGGRLSPGDLDFPHDGGLVVRAAGATPSPLVASLRAIAAENGAALARLRARFRILGERHAQGARRTGAGLAGTGPNPVLLDLRRTLATTLIDNSRHRAEARARDAAIETLTEEVARLTRAQEQAAIADAAFRATIAAAAEAASRQPLGRRLGRAIRRRIRPPPGVAPPAHDLGPDAGPDPGPVPGPVPGPPHVPGPEPARTGSRILFVAGEPDKPGAVLRTERQASACRAAGIDAASVAAPEVGPATIENVAMLVLWRVAWSPHVETMIALCRAAGAAIVFDVDDLVTEPALARIDILDALRFADVDPAELADYFERLRLTAAAADLCVATTEELADALRAANACATVIPNGYDSEMLETARRAVRMREVVAPEGDGLVRIGYAAGTRTHQRDFAAAAAGLARTLASFPETRLVLFRDKDGAGTLIPEEFEALAGFGRQIEWRDIVPLAELPAEIARFDIAICPLDVANVFCQSKSELKYVEAALASVPCVASPTGPLARAITHGRNGMLVSDPEGWFASLSSLVADPGLRRRLGFAAHADVLWRHGPRRRAELWGGLLRRHADQAARARETELAIRRGAYGGAATPVAAPTETLFAHDTLEPVAVAVAITSFNYADFILEALDSVAAQDLADLELVVVDDASADGSVELILDWARAHHARFRRLRVERCLRNSGLGPTRNAAFAASEAPYVMSLDADNRLRPECCAALLALITAEDAAFAYSTIPQFGDMQYAISALPYEPLRFVPGNYIDAMALVAKWAWAAAGGYYDNPDARGWEDFDLWCSLAELGQRGVWHPEPLCDYRVHAGSMTNAVTERSRNKRNLVTFLEDRHPWLRLKSREEALRL